VFIPPNMLDEVKALPDDVLSLLEAFAEVRLRSPERKWRDARC